MRKDSAAARRAIRAQQDGNQVVMVVSAMGHKTDQADRPGRSRSPTSPPAREMDMLLSTGEQVSVALMAMAIHSLGARGDQPDRRADRHTHRQHAHQGPHPVDLDRPHAQAARRGQDRHRRRLPGHRRGLQHHHARPRRQRYHGRGPGRRAAAPTPAKSTPTSTASTRPIRGIVPEARKIEPHQLRRNARAGQPRAPA